MGIEARDSLLARQYAYTILHIIFGQKPSESILATAFSEQSLETLNAIAHTSMSSFGEEVVIFGELKSSYLDPDPDIRAQALHSLSIEYTRLFVGPNALEASPWEMVYQTGKRELFQPGIVKIRAIYKSEGCSPAESPNVSDDHLGIELDFMRFLCGKTQKALEQDDEAEVARIEAVQRDFLKEHLLNWVPAYIQDLRRATREPFFAVAGGMLQAFIELDATLLQV